MYYTLTSRKKLEGKNRVKDLDPEKYRENTTDFIQVAGLHFNFTKKIPKKIVKIQWILKT